MLGCWRCLQLFLFSCFRIIRAFVILFSDGIGISGAVPNRQQDCTMRIRHGFRHVLKRKDCS